MSLKMRSTAQGHYHSCHFDNSFPRQMPIQDVETWSCIPPEVSDSLYPYLVPCIRHCFLKNEKIKSFLLSVMHMLSLRYELGTLLDASKLITNCTREKKRKTENQLQTPVFCFHSGTWHKYSSCNVHHRWNSNLLALGLFLEGIRKLQVRTTNSASTGV